MAYGIQIMNSSGVVTISEDYRNYHLMASGTYANGGTTPTPAAGEILFVRPSSNGAYVYPSPSAGARIKSTTGAVSWAILRESPTVSSDTMGLRVYTPSGAIAYDSTRRSLVPVSVTRWAQPSYGGGSIGITQPFAPMSGRTRYVNSAALRNVGIAESGIGFYDHWRITRVYWANDSSMTLEETLNTETPAPAGTDFPLWGGTMVFSFVDV